MSVRRLRPAVIGLCTIASLFAIPTPALAAPPTNDFFASAQTISGSSGSVSGTNVDATGEVGEPDNMGDSAPIQSAWYSWTAPATGKFLFGTCNDTTFDTTLGVYTGTSVSSLSSVAEDMNSCGSGESNTPNRVRSAVSFSAVSGTTYHLSVDGLDAYSGTFTLFWKPANDDFADAEVLSGASGSVQGMNPHFGREEGEPDNAGVSSPIQSAWFTWTAPETARFTFDTCTKTPMDTTLGVYSGTAVNALSSLGQNDDACSTNAIKSRVTFSAEAGKTYHISVDGPETWTGWFILKWGYPPPSADLSVEKSDSADPVPPGSNVTYTMVVSNAGPDSATQIALSDSMDDSTNYVSHTTSQGTCAAPDVGASGPVECTLGTIESGSSATVTVTVKTTVAATIGDTVRVSSNPSEDDPDLTDRVDSEVTFVKEETPADLSVDNVDSVDPVATGSNVTYTIVVSNAGTDTATGVTMSDTLDEGTQYLRHRTSQGSCQTSSVGSTESLECALGTIAAESEATVTITVQVTLSDTPGTVLNIATVTSNEEDPDVEDRSQSEATNVETNLLRNGDFEIDANRDNRPDNWSSNAKFTRRNKVVFSGDFSGRHRATDNAGYVIQQTVSGLTGRVLYRFLGHVNASQTRDKFTLRLQVRWKNGANRTIGTTLIEAFTAPTGGWVASRRDLLAPSGAAKAQVRMALSSLNATVHVDQFLLYNTGAMAPPA